MSRRISDYVQIGSWDEVKGVPLSSFTGDKADDAVLDGLIIKGYEMRWGEANANGECYDKGAFDEWINDYFVKRKLNMPLTLMHGQTFDDLCGRVLYVETNSVGFYVVAYVPRTYFRYNGVKAAVAEGILQGFSKEGFADDYSVTEDGTLKIKKMQIIGVSLVSVPANGVPFEAAGETQEIQNALRANLNADKKPGGGDLFAELFK